MKNRKRKPQSGRVIIGVSMSPAMADELVKIANEEDRPLASVCRMAIRHYWKIDEKVVG